MKIDFALPVYNEEDCLAASVSKLISYLQSKVSCDWQVIIVDNASTDETPVIAEALASEIEKVHAVRLELKGRGYALRSVFQSSQADAICYMDIDLSTDLNHIEDLIGGLQDGYDIVVGSRLLPASRTVRSFKREFISRSYNILVRVMFGYNSCSDFQCGFKAFRCNLRNDLLPKVKDNRFFFDTEILLFADQLGYCILDVPVNWVEKPDSKVDLIPTILEDLVGLARVRATIRR